MNTRNVDCSVNRIQCYQAGHNARCVQFTSLLQSQNFCKEKCLTMTLRVLEYTGRL